PGNQAREAIDAQENKDLYQAQPEFRPENLPLQEGKEAWIAEPERWTLLEFLLTPDHLSSHHTEKFCQEGEQNIFQSPAHRISPAPTRNPWDAGSVSLALSPKRASRPPLTRAKSQG